MSKIEKGQFGEPWSSEVRAFSMDMGGDHASSCSVESLSFKGERKKTVARIGSARRISDPLNIAITERITECVNVLDGWDIKEVRQLLEHAETVRCCPEDESIVFDNGEFRCR